MIDGLRRLGAGRGDSTTIGVAVALPEPVRGEIAALRRRLRDPYAHVIVPHITVVPPLDMDAAALREVEAHLEEVARQLRPFVVELAGSATFRPVSPVVFVPLVAGADEVRRLEAVARQGPLAGPIRFPFHPHVTVLQDASDAALDAAVEEVSGYRAGFAVPGVTLFVMDAAGTWRAHRMFGFPVG